MLCLSVVTRSESGSRYCNDADKELNTKPKVMKLRGEGDALELIKSYSFSSTKSPVKTWKDEVKGWHNI